MTANHPTPGASSPGKPAKQLRVTGVVILLVGLAIAGAVYWIGTYAGGPTEDQLAAANARAEARQMGVLYGKMGLLTHELADDLRQPGVQAALIVAASVLVALGCFYVARLSEEDEEAP